MEQETRSLKLRNLGTFERFRTVIHDLGFHYNVAIAARYSSSSTILSRGLLYPALREAIKEHPALSVTIMDRHTTTPYFVRLATINLSKVVSTMGVALDSEGNPKGLDEILSKENSLGFDYEDLPLWRVVLLEGSKDERNYSVDLILIWHHAIADGRSGLAFHSTILKALKSSASTPIQDRALDELAVVIPSPKLLPPSLEEMLALPTSLRTRIALLYKSWLRPWYAQDDASKWSGAPYSYKLPITTLIQHITIPARSVALLMERCRSERTSITAFLQTLIGKVIMETFDEVGRLRCAIAISLRRFFPKEYEINEEMMGLWVSAFHREYSRTQLVGSQENAAFPWDDARQNKQRYVQEIAKRDRDMSIGLLKHVKDFRSTLMGKIGKKREDSFAVTNLGLWNANLNDSPRTQQGSFHPWSISNVIFSQSCHVNGSALQFCIASLQDGDMSIALSWQEGVVSVDEASQIRKVLEQQLLDVVDNVSY